MAKMLRDIARRRKMVFQKGDVVRIITGETKGLVCIVKQVKEHTVVLTARDASLALATDIEVSPAQLEKYFQVNDHVKILDGLYRGQTGTITSVNNGSGLPYATMLPDSHSIKKEMEAFTRDLVLTTEHCGAVELSGDAAGSADGAAASGDTGMRRAAQTYQLDDLVQLDADIRAVVVRVEYDHYVLVDNFNKMHRLTPDQIQGRKMSKSTANDKYRNIVSQGDVIYVVHGRKDLLKKTGTVRQIWKGTLFVALSDRTELPDTNGIFVIRSSDVYLLGGRTVESKEPKEFYRPPPRSENGLAARGGGRPGGKGREVDPLVGKRVMMSKGIHKRFVGRIKFASGKVIRVALDARPAIVECTLDDVLFIDGHGDPILPNAVSAAPDGRGREVERPRAMATPGTQYAPATPFVTEADSSATNNAHLGVPAAENAGGAATPGGGVAAAAAAAAATNAPDAGIIGFLQDRDTRALRIPASLETQYAGIAAAKSLLEHPTPRPIVDVTPSPFAMVPKPAVPLQWPDTVTEDIEVMIKEGAQQNKVAVVRKVLPGGQIEVEVEAGNPFVVQASSTVRTEVRVGRMVKLLDGQHVGVAGKFVSREEGELVVQLSSGLTVLVPASDCANFVPRGEAMLQP